MLRVSQPQLHNVLKGARKLHAPLADAMLLKFQTSILDLLSEAELAVLEERIAEGLRNGEKHRLQGLRKRPGSFRRDRSEWEAS